MDYSSQRAEYLAQSDYNKLAKLYEQVIELEPDIASHYWHLGLAYLLNSQEQEAQVTWLAVLSQGSDQEIALWTAELVQILETEAQRQQLLIQPELSWLIRQHIREIAPHNINNLLNLLILSIETRRLTVGNFSEWGINDILKQSSLELVDSELLLQLLPKLFDYLEGEAEVVDFVKICYTYLSHQKSLMKMFIPYPSINPKICSLIQKLKHYSLSAYQALYKLYMIGEYIAVQNIPGDFVECGVFNGGSAAIVASALDKTGKKAWLYDSFEGMPPTTGIDGDFAKSYVGKVVGSEEKVKEAMKIAGFPESNCIIHKGWFQNTFKYPLPQKVAILHIDADWYDSVMLCLETFYDLVSEKGVIIFDDFGHWEGCREAFYDFASKRKIKPLLERCGHTQAYFVKGKIHNRDFANQLVVP